MRWLLRSCVHQERRVLESLALRDELERILVLALVDWEAVGSVEPGALYPTEIGRLHEDRFTPEQGRDGVPVFFQHRGDFFHYYHQLDVLALALRH